MASKKTFKKAAPKSAAPRPAPQKREATLTIPQVQRLLSASNPPPTQPPRVIRSVAVTPAEKKRREVQAAKDRACVRHQVSERGNMILSRANDNLWRSNNVNTWRGVSSKKMKSIQKAHNARLTPEMKKMSNYLLSSAKEDPLMTAFAMQYANPFAHYGVRYLGPTENSVGVYTMFRTVDIPINTTNGRFAACLQPKIGNAELINEWQLLLVDGAATAWDDGDWTAETNYLVNSSAGDLRVDPNYASIATSQVAMRSFKSEVSFSRVIGAYTDADYAFASDQNDFNVTVTANADGPTYSFPVGQPRRVRIWVEFQHGTAAATTGTQTATVTGGVTVNITDFFRNTRLATSTAITTTANYGFYAADLDLDGSAGTLRLQYAGGTSATTATISYYCEIRPAIIGTIDFGAFSSVQPVAAGIWAEWVGPLIENAGNICSCLAPVNSVNQDWLTTGSTAGRFRPQYWEEYVQLQPGNNNKVYPDGRIDEGAVAMWRPQRPEDQELFKPSVHNATTYGPMYIAGQYNTSTGTIPAGAIVRLFVTITYQYETSNRLLAVASNPIVYANSVPAAENLLHAVGVPIAGANGFHEWWAQMIKDVGGFFSDLGGMVGIIWQNFVGNLRPKIGYKDGPFKIEV